VVASIVVIREAEVEKTTPKVVIAVVTLAVAFSGVVVLALAVSSASHRNAIATFQVVDERLSPGILVRVLRIPPARSVRPDSQTADQPRQDFGAGFCSSSIGMLS
jgi:hypothetical protein